MDIGALTPLEIVSSCTGVTINVEQRVMLENSLSILQADNKAKEIKFLGVILGLDGDYFLAQTIGEDVLKDLKCFYSTDCRHWSLLQECHPKLVEGASKVRGRFTGDPAHDYESRGGGGGGGGGGEEEEPVATGMLLKEEDRLAYVVHQLLHEVAIVPRKALLYTPSGAVIRNPSFRGLHPVEADRLESYMHLRVPSSNPLKRTAADADLSIDFLEALSQDPFKDSWTVVRCYGGRLVTVRCLVWPGFVFFHRVTSGDYGFCYMGTGQRCLDVPFMLPSAYPPPPPALIVECDADEGEEELWEEEGEEEEEEEEEEDKAKTEGEEEDKSKAEGEEEEKTRVEAEAGVEEEEKTGEEAAEGEEGGEVAEEEEEGAEPEEAAEGEGDAEAEGAGPPSDA